MSKSNLGKDIQPISKPHIASVTPNYRILLFIPNIIGYLRLCFLLGAFCCYTSPVLFLFLYSISVSLDFTDGYFARKFNQCSLFGAWFDVVIDVISRGSLWIRAHPVLYIISAIEWLSFVCTHSLGVEWTEKLRTDIYSENNLPPTFVSRIMANHFRNPWGFFAICGLHVFPIWVVGMQLNIFENYLYFLPVWLPMAGCIVLGLGRLLALLAELWSIWYHVKMILTVACID